MARTYIFNGVLCLMLLFTFLSSGPQIPATLAAPEAPAQPATLAQLPDAAPPELPREIASVPNADDWWGAVQTDLSRREYAIAWVEHTALPDLAGAYQAPNRAHALRTYFTPEGVRIIPRISSQMLEAGQTAQWEWRLTLTGYGYADALQPVATAVLTTTEARITYQRGALTEWYVNDERGLEQGFTLTAPPPARAAQSTAIALELALGGDLTLLSADSDALLSDALVFATADGTPVLRYGDLYVYDATRRQLPARFDLTTTGVQIVFDAAGAVYPITVDPIASSPAWTVNGPTAGEGLGFAVSGAGDVNGDGYADVIVGAPYADLGLTEVGAAYLYLGSRYGLATSPAKSIYPSWGYECLTYCDYGHFGYAVATAGDVNGDGRADVIIGYPGYSGYFGFAGGLGRIHIYYGAPGGLNNDYWYENGDAATSYFGWSVGTAGDVNHDGYADIIAGEPYYDNGEASEGRVYVYHGGAGGPDGTPDWSAEGNYAEALFGAAVATAGDVNKDGYADVIIGAPTYDHQNVGGRAYVYYGGAGGLAATPAWTGECEDHYRCKYGYAVSTAGDVNDDGYADIIVGAKTEYGFRWVYSYGWWSKLATYEGGNVYAYLGGPSGLATSPNWHIYGDQDEGWLGAAVGRAGDIDGDGFDDVLVGAPGYHNGEADEGRAYVYRGGAGGLATSPTWTGESNQAGANYGTSVGSAGDVNGDGVPDIIVGAPKYDGAAGADTGRAYVYHTIAPPTPQNISPGTALESNQTGAQLGFAVSSAGDVNGDGYDDVIVGAPYYDNGQSDEGRAFVYHGGAAGLAATPAWTAESNQADARLGWSVSAAGDVNGDGYRDVIVGAPFYDTTQTDVGRVLVYHGSASGLATTAAWTMDGDQANANFGRPVGAAGDVNGDGYDDVIISALNYDNGETDEGRVVVYYGGASGLAAAPAWSVEGDQDYAYLSRVSTAGDVNGDGYSDVLIGAPNYDNGQTDEGRAFVYHGSSSGLSAAADWTMELNLPNIHFGTLLSAAGDVNGDGYSEILVSSDARTYLYYGGANGLGGSAAWSVPGQQGSGGDFNGDGYSDVMIRNGDLYVYLAVAGGLDAYPAFSASTSGYSNLVLSAAGDVNGDGFADMLAGARDYDGGQTDEGRVLVYYGRAPGYNPEPGWNVISDYPDNYGYAVDGAGDVNGDGYADVIVGAPNYDNGETNEGRALVYLGGPDGVNGNAVWTVEGNQAGARLGEAVGGAGDVNGDGYGDVIVGAPGYDNGQTDEGRVYLYYGSASGLTPTPAWIGESDQAGAGWGLAVGGAGDVNSDGYGDVVVGAASGAQAYVYHGGPDGLSAAPDWIGVGAGTFGRTASAAGDVNGDGYGDVIIGAPAYYYDGGSSYVYHGGPGGLAAAAAWSGLGGDTVNAAGDVNGDGYGDVVVAGMAYVHVYHGSVGGLAAAPAWTDTSLMETEPVHFAADGAGDVNGDGYDDLIVGHASASLGRAYLYHGSATGVVGHIQYWPWEDWDRPAWQQAHDGSDYGRAAAGAGDVNGDGYADFIIGQAYELSYEGGNQQAFVYSKRNNSAPLMGALPQLRRVDDSAPVYPGGQSLSPTTARVQLNAPHAPFGFSDVRLQWEVKPAGVAFDGTGLGVSAWQESGQIHYALDELISGLPFERYHHWRVRVLARPASAATDAATYRSPWLDGDTFFTALSGEQAISGTGNTNLVQQLAYVDVFTQGTLTNLTLRGYPQTAHPRANAASGAGLMLGRYFTLTPNAGAGGYDLSLCLNYDEDEIPAGYNERQLYLCRWTGSAWDCLPRSDRSSIANNLVCADHVTASSEWGIGVGLDHVYARPAVSAGENHTCELKADGTLYCWGDNSYWQTDVPSPNADWVQVSAGRRHTCGLKVDGTVRCWGWNNFGQTTVPSPNANWIQVAAGRSYTCGLKADGTLQCWGADSYGQTAVPSPNTNWIQVTAGDPHTCGLKADRTLQCWGYSSLTSVPTPNANWIQVRAGYVHTCGLKADGTLHCWGWSSSGSTTVPEPNTDWRQVSAGSYYNTCALKADRTLQCWGDNTSGQTNVPEPNTNWVQVSGGGYHTCALKADGALYCWGSNANGQAPVITLAPDTLPNAIVNTAYAQTITASGGSAAPYTFSIISGSTPTGLTLNANGAWSGAPTTPGVFNFTAQARDANNIAAARAYTLIVDKINTTTTLAASQNPSRFGQSVSFTAQVTPAAAGGTVAFKDGGVTISGCASVSLSSGQATCTTAALTVGSHSITAVYSGNANYNGSTSATLTQGVNKANTTTSITSDAPDPSVVGQAVVVNYAVAVTAPGAGTPTGNVTVSDGSVSCVGTVAAGTCSLTPTTAGAKTLTATYAGDANFNGSSGTTAHQVNKANTSTALSSSLNPSTYGSSVTFTAQVSPLAASGTVAFKNGGVDIPGCASVTLSGGQATCTTSALAVGSHTITAVYSGDGNYNGSTSAALTQTVNKANTSTALSSSANPSTYGSSVTFTAQVAPAAASGTVAFKDGGVDIPGCAAVSLSGGQATCATAALAVGSHSITAVYSGDATYAGSTGTLAPDQQVGCANNLTVTNANDSGAGSLRQALSDVCVGGTVTFAGDYTIRLASQLTIGKNLTVNGAGHSVTVSGDTDNNGAGNVRVFLVNAGVTFDLLNLTVEKGNCAACNGGGIRNDGVLNVTRVTFFGNTGALGGGIFNNGTLSVGDSTFSGNTAASWGGGVHNEITKNFLVHNSTFSGNAAGTGGEAASIAMARSSSTTAHSRRTPRLRAAAFATMARCTC